MYVIMLFDLIYLKQELVTKTKPLRLKTVLFGDVFISLR